MLAAASINGFCFYGSLLRANFSIVSLFDTVIVRGE